MPAKPCAECESSRRAPGKTKCLDCLDAADRFSRERRRKRLELADCETCAYRNGNRCAYYPPRESEQPLTPGWCNFWLPVANADPEPNGKDDDEQDPDPADDWDPADEDPLHAVSVEGAASAAQDYGDDEYEEYDGYRPGQGW